MQSKNVKELHSNFVNFGKCDGDIKYMTLTDLLSLLKKNELEASILEIEIQRLVLSSIYECICGDNGDLQDLSIQCLPYMTIQFNNGEMIDLSLKLCKHLQNDLPSKKEDEEKYNAILRQCIVITNAIKSMCTANRLLLSLHQERQKIPTPHLMSTTPSSSVMRVTDSPLLLPKTPFYEYKSDMAASAAAADKKDDDNEFEHEYISRLIESLSSLLLNIIASKQQSMRIEFTKHRQLQTNELSKNRFDLISFEHYHEQILFALDILLTIIDNHGDRVSFIFESATNVLFNLLSGAHHDYAMINTKISSDVNTKILESKKVNKCAIQCLGSLSRFLPNNELKQIINTLCLTCTKCMKTRQYSTLKNLFDAINKISMVYKYKEKGLSTELQSKLCLSVLNVISSEDIKEEIEVREYGLMATETLICNTSSSNIISLFPQFIHVLSDGLRYDPNYAYGDSKGVEDEDNKSEGSNTGWTDDDDDDSWGNNDDDDDGDIKMENQLEEDAEYFEKLDELNRNLDDDDDDSWKVRRASNKCLLAMIHCLIETKRDFNPNMLRLIKENIISILLSLLNQRCCERVRRIKINIFETYNTLLIHLNATHDDAHIYTTLSGDVIEGICNAIANKEYLNEVLVDDDPDVYYAFFNILRNIVGITRHYSQYPTFIPYILALSISTISHYTNNKWNDAISSVFQCIAAIYSTYGDDDTHADAHDYVAAIFSLSLDICTKCTSHVVLDSMFQFLTIFSKYLDDEKQCILLKQCIARLQQREQRQNVINSTAACLTMLLHKDCDSSTLQIGMQLGDELMMNETTRLNGIKLSISCIKSLHNDADDGDGIIESIIGKFSSFLKQNSSNVRFLALDGLVLTFDRNPFLCKHFVLSLSEMISLLKNIFSLNSNELCHRLKQFISVLIHLFQCPIIVDDVQSLFNAFVLPLLECVTHCNVMDAALYPLWRQLWCLIARKLQGMMHEDESDSLCAFMNSMHDKLMGNNLIMSTKTAQFDSCWCAASFFNEFIHCATLETFFVQWCEEAKDNTSNKVNDILLSQLLMISRQAKQGKIVNKYRNYVQDRYAYAANQDRLYISSCYLLQYSTNCDEFMNLICKLSASHPPFALNTLSKVIEAIQLMDQNSEYPLLIGGGLHKLMQFVCTFSDEYFAQCATVIAHLLCNEISHKDTFAVIDGWIRMDGDRSRYRLGMESLTSAFSALMINVNTFSKLIQPPFVSCVMSLINDPDLMVSFSALKNMKFLLKFAFSFCNHHELISKLLFILLNRTKSSPDYMDKISFGPITKLVDKSSSVRCLAFEVIADIVEYNADYINKEFIEKSIYGLMDALRSKESNLVNAAIQSFQLLIRSGFIVSSHITQEFIECIATEIEDCKGKEGTNMDSNKKEKLAHLVHFYAVLRKSIANILSLQYANETWNSISSLITQIQHNPSFLTRTPSTVYNGNMQIGQSLLLSPSLRSDSVSTLQRDNSLQYLEPLNAQQNINNTLNHTNRNTTNTDMVDLD